VRKSKERIDQRTILPSEKSIPKLKKLFMINNRNIEKAQPVVILWA